MTFKEIFENYPKHDFPDHEWLCSAVVDILRVGMKLEEDYFTPDESYRQYMDDKLWVEITENKIIIDGVPTIGLPILRNILEKYHILNDEKDGM